MFEVFWTETLRSLLPWAEIFFRVITEMGSDYFYVALIAIGFWSINKKNSIITAMVLLVSTNVNYWLKTALANPRPPVSNWLSGVSASSYSLPSAHAQNSITLWGWLRLKIRTWWMTIISVFLIITIGLSRIYLGVHWLGDVLLGWGVGFLILIILWKIEKPLNDKLSNYNPHILYFGLVLFGLIAMVLTEFITKITIIGLNDNFGANGGLMVGLGIGLSLENKFVDFKISYEKKWRLGLRVIIGLMFLFLIVFGLAPILKTDVYWLRAIRYTLGALVAIFIWPFIFKKLGL